MRIRPEGQSYPYEFDLVQVLLKSTIVDKTLDLFSVVGELSIFENMFTNTMTGNISYDKEDKRRRELRDEAYEKDEDFDYDQFKDEKGNDEHDEKYYDGTTRQDREDFYNKETEL